MDDELAAGWNLSVAVSGAAIVGMLALRPGVLDQLFIAPDWQREDIGSILFAHACVEMPQGFGLRTQAANEPARRFYEARGMRLERLGPHPGGLPRPCAWYRWP